MMGIYIFTIATALSIVSLTQNFWVSVASVELQPNIVVKNTGLECSGVEAQENTFIYSNIESLRNLNTNLDSISVSIQGIDTN